MKKVLVLAVAVVLLPAFASAATTTCNPGNYKGSLWSVSKDLNGKVGTLTVTKEGDKCVMKFKTEGSNEVWELSGSTLVQKEFDTTGKVAQTYGATLQNDKFVVNCKDKAKNVCDGDVDYRNYWQLINTPDGGYKYIVYGVGQDNKSNPTAIVAKRHEFTFNPEKAAVTTTTTTTTPAATTTKTTTTTAPVTK